MPAIQSLTITYDALNEYGTFSEGDTLTGKVTLALYKETSVESLFVKAKGDANVRWTKKSGDHTHTYQAHTRYFKLKQFLIPEDSRETVVPQGIHIYNFSLDIPPGSMPSSFKGHHGKIVYKLEAKLSRSWKMDRTVEKDIHFVSKSYPNLVSLMSRQVGSTKKEMGLFSKGHVHMDVIVDKSAYAPGETMAIVAKINNSSSKDMIPKFSLIQDVVYRAKSSTKHASSVIHKVVDNCIKPRTERDVRCEIQIPRVQMPTIQNCDIISVEYHLMAYLDISFAFDPEIKFPVVIIPPDLARGFQPSVAGGPYHAGAAGGPSNTGFPPPAASMDPYPSKAIGGPGNNSFPPPAVFMGPYPVSPHSGNYGYPGAQRYSAPPAVYPAHPPHMSGGYNNPVPQLASPYQSPFSSSSSSSVLHPPPTVPTFQPPPSAPSHCPPPFSISPTAPAYNLLSSAPMMDTDFLSQSNEAPPAYSLLFPSSATDKSDAK
ncbi:arrestin domain-containing protein 3-like [Anarrhichthys ocellatus]|uniref:arrestin domain-containing protein 3-like n=1 Tax=Anarrhichthys ocellatus TaxID=433405 RepID=UPI0012ECD56F|nr:arrestin domain-containing protein 3-like [Anarrhichthys ocellatus]